MRDPLIHAPKDVVVTHAVLRDIIARTTGLAPDAPKTVTTGCGRRRPYAMTSVWPAAVTCLACREHAADQHEQYEQRAHAASETLGGDSRTRVIQTPRGSVVQTITRRDLLRVEIEHADMAAAFRDPP